MVSELRESRKAADFELGQYATAHLYRTGLFGNSTDASLRPVVMFTLGKAGQVYLYSHFTYTQILDTDNKQSA